MFPIGNFTNCTSITALKTSEQLNERKNCSNVNRSGYLLIHKVRWTAISAKCTDIHNSAVNYAIVVKYFSIYSF